jgi:hypothetical protein
MPDQQWIRAIARELRKKGDEHTRQPDWWARAGVISSFFSSVVIAAVGLAISSSFQKAQLASSEAAARAQIEFARLKNDDDKRLQENRFAADLVQHLLSDEPRHRALAVMMLRRTVAISMYEEVVSVLAQNDPDARVRKTAIEQLGMSRNPAVAVTLNNISRDPARSQSERLSAVVASTSVALAGRLGSGTCLFMSTSPGGPSYEDDQLGGGIFTHFLLQALERRSGANDLTPTSLGDFLTTSVRAYNPFGSRAQTPFTSFEGYRIDGPFFPPGAETFAVVVGVSDYADPDLSDLKYGHKDALRVSKVLSDKGARVTTLVDKAATRENILSSLNSIAKVAKSEKTTDIIFYYSGQGMSINGQAFLIVHESRLNELDKTSLKVESVRTALGMVPFARRILFLDASSNDPGGNR